MYCSSKEQSHIKKDKAAKWIFKCRGVDEENLQLQTDECETTMVDYHSGEKLQLKANKKRKPEIICDQDLCNQRSQLDDRNSTHRITNERDMGKLRCSFLSQSKANYSLILSSKEREKRK